MERPGQARPSACRLHRALSRHSLTAHRAGSTSPHGRWGDRGDDSAGPSTARDQGTASRTSVSRHPIPSRDASLRCLPPAVAPRHGARDGRTHGPGPHFSVQVVNAGSTYGSWALGLARQGPRSGPGFLYPRVASVTSGGECDGSHRFRVGCGVTYGLLTTRQFNICNCTTSPCPLGAGRGTRLNPNSPSSNTSRGARRLGRQGPGQPGRAHPHWRGSQKRSRRTRRSPARSTIKCRWGQRPDVCGRGHRFGVWAPNAPGYAVISPDQTSLRCCGMPASNARTSASR